MIAGPYLFTRQTTATPAISAARITAKAIITASMFHDARPRAARNARPDRLLP
jgi:hypothetical protein